MSDSGGDGFLDDARPHRDEVRPRLRAGGPEDRGRRPRRVVEARALPSHRDVGPVDVLGVVDQVALEVALGARQPRPGAHPPRPVRGDQLRRPVAVEDRHLHDAPRVPRRVALRRPLPAVHEGQRVGRPRVQQLGDVEGLVVLGVGIAVGLALAGAGGVHVELVLLVPRDVGARPHDRRGAQGDLLAGVGVLVGLQARLAPDPLRLPVGVTEAGLEGGRHGEGPRTPRRRPGADRPAVDGVGRERTAPVGDEGLRRGIHPAAVPDRGGPAPAARRQAGHHQPVGALDRTAAGVGDLPPEVDVGDVEADGGDQPVGAERHRRGGGTGGFDVVRAGGARRCRRRGARTPRQAAAHHAGGTDEASFEHLAPAQGPGSCVVSSRALGHPVTLGRRTRRRRVAWWHRRTRPAGRSAPRAVVTPGAGAARRQDRGAAVSWTEKTFAALCPGVHTRTSS